MTSNAFILSCLASIAWGHGYMPSFGGQAMMAGASSGPAGNAVQLATSGDICHANNNDGGSTGPSAFDRGTYQWKSLDNPVKDDWTQAPIVRPQMKHINFYPGQKLNVTIAIGANHRGSYAIDADIRHTYPNVTEAMTNGSIRYQNKAAVYCANENSTFCVDDVWKTWRFAAYATVDEDPDATYFTRWDFNVTDAEKANLNSDTADGALTTEHTEKNAFTWGNTRWQCYGYDKSGKRIFIAKGKSDSGSECLYYFYKEIVLNLPDGMVNTWIRPRLTWGKILELKGNTDLITTEYYPKCADVYVQENSALAGQDVDSKLSPPALSGGGNGGGSPKAPHYFANRTATPCPHYLTSVGNMSDAEKMCQATCTSTEGVTGERLKSVCVTNEAFCHPEGSAKAQNVPLQCYYKDNRICANGESVQSLKKGSCCITNGPGAAPTTCGSSPGVCRESCIKDNPGMCGCSPEQPAPGCEWGSAADPKICPKDGQTCQFSGTRDKNGYAQDCSGCATGNTAKSNKWACENKCKCSGNGPAPGPTPAPTPTACYGDYTGKNWQCGSNDCKNADPSSKIKCGECKDHPVVIGAWLCGDANTCVCSANGPAPGPTPAPAPTPTPPPAPAGPGCVVQPSQSAFKAYCDSSICQCAGGKMTVGTFAQSTYCMCPPEPTPAPTPAPTPPPTPAPKSNYKVCPGKLAARPVDGDDAIDCAVCEKLATVFQGTFCNGKISGWMTNGYHSCTNRDALCYKVDARQLDAPTLIV